MDLAAVGHRVVHGGPDLYRPTVIDDARLAQLRELADLAPLHNPPAVLGIEVARKLLPELPHVAVFDTAFFHDLPAAARTYAIDRNTAAAWKIRRYGFHGTSHAFVSAQAAEFLGVPVESLNQIVLHLGNGASASAIAGGRPVDTSMGMTPMEGLVMGTRSGDVDPGIIAYLWRTAGMGVAEIEGLLNRRSGVFDSVGRSTSGCCTNGSVSVTRRRNWPTTSTSTGCASTWAAIWPCSGTPTSSRSPPGWGRTTRKSAGTR